MHITALNLAAAPEGVEVSRFTHNGLYLTLAIIVVAILFVVLCVGVLGFDPLDLTTAVSIFAPIVAAILVFFVALPAANLAAGIDEAAAAADATWESPKPASDSRMPEGVRCTNDDGEQYRLRHADGTVSPAALSITKANGKYYFAVVSTDECELVKR